VTGSGVGTGAAAVGYTVAANPGPARSGTIMIQGGQVVTVSQAGTVGTAFNNVTPLPIADNLTQNSPLTVSGLSGRIRDVTVSLSLTHTFDADLTISLIAPDGTAIDLSIENGGSANNYGSACAPLSSRTTFDDSAPNLIAHGSAPFVGSFRPEQPLARFNGKSGTSANGTWKLRIKDSFAGDTGTLNCWSVAFNSVRAIRSDFTGDGSDDVAVYRPATAEWLVPGQGSVSFGTASDIPVPGDYNGDHVEDIAVFRPSTDQWFVRNQFTLAWGGHGDVPVPGDYNGDGITDVAVYRPSTGDWFVRNQFTVSLGGPGYIPVVGDYNGDGIDDVAVYQASTGTAHPQPDEFVRRSRRSSGAGGLQRRRDYGYRRVSAVHRRVVRAGSVHRCVGRAGRHPGAARLRRQRRCGRRGLSAVDGSVVRERSVYFDVRRHPRHAGAVLGRDPRGGCRRLRRRFRGRRVGLPAIDGPVVRGQSAPVVFGAPGDLPSRATTTATGELT
jgi:subtilisin-like proprotein convertase family protein